MAEAGPCGMLETARKEVILVPTETLTKHEYRASPASPKKDELGAAERIDTKRVRRLKINVAAWVLGTTLLTTLWAVNQWQANGALESFGHEGNPGQWNPTLWALGVGIWGLVVGIMALGVLVRHRFRFHVAAWLLGMIVLTPLWALIEWQDNGGFERWSNNSRPGDWEPWILYVAGIWALVIAILALSEHLSRRPTHS